MSTENTYPLVQARDPWGLIIDPKTLVWNEVPQTLSVVPQDWFRPWGLAVAWWSRMKVPPSHIMSEQHVRQKLQIFSSNLYGTTVLCQVVFIHALISSKSVPILFQHVRKWNLKKTNINKIKKTFVTRLIPMTYPEVQSI